jgi:LAO/AO transport system kinase
LGDRLATIMPSDTQINDTSGLVRRLTNGDRAALSRLLTLAARGDVNESLAAALKNQTKGRPPVIAITGSAGVGKSSLLGAVTAHFAAQGERICVLACDPESPITGGALLGDRCRIAGNSDTSRIFIRSLSTAAGQQGIASNIESMLDVMKAFGFDRIFIETVGAGQGDIAVRSVADVVVLVLQPQTGDELQWEKAGILEIADVVVVNKSDLPGSEQTAADVMQQLQSAHGPVIPVLTTSVARAEGIEKLCRALDAISVADADKRRKL